MTEPEWLACTDPTLMLEFLKGKASDRKLRLFAVACCRRFWGVGKDTRSRQAVEVAERFADGLETDENRQTVFEMAGEAVCDPTPALSPWSRQHTEEERAALAVAYSRSVVGFAMRNAAATAIPIASLLRRLTEAAAYEAFDVSDQPAFTASDIAEDGERIEQAALLREIFGNPYRPASIDPAWLTFDVRMIAKGAYQDRASDRLPILAGALQDAGCKNEDILTHLRGAGPHVPGCWAVDLLLGKS